MYLNIIMGFLALKFLANPDNALGLKLRILGSC